MKDDKENIANNENNAPENKEEKISSEKKSSVGEVICESLGLVVVAGFILLALFMTKPVLGGVKNYFYDYRTATSRVKNYKVTDADVVVKKVSAVYDSSLVHPGRKITNSWESKQFKKYLKVKVTEFGGNYKYKMYSNFKLKHSKTGKNYMAIVPRPVEYQAYMYATPELYKKLSFQN